MILSPANLLSPGNLIWKFKGIQTISNNKQNLRELKCGRNIPLYDAIVPVVPHKAAAEVSKIGIGEVGCCDSRMAELIH